MDWLCKLERLVLNFLKLMIALRVADRLRGSWNKRMARGSQGRHECLKATADAHRQSNTRRHNCRKIAIALKTLNECFGRLSTVIGASRDLWVFNRLMIWRLTIGCGAGVVAFGSLSCTEADFEFHTGF